MIPTVATAIDTVMRLADELARKRPHNRDIKRLQELVRKMAQARPRAPARQRPPGYWAEIKRRQRARQRSAPADERAPPGP